jgi:hypothetical protein
MSNGLEKEGILKNKVLEPGSMYDEALPLGRLLAV